MIKQILRATGLPGWPGRCPDPPGSTYAIYFDNVTADGPDGRNGVYTHDIMLELYSPRADDAAEADIEAELDARGLHYTKQACYWLGTTQRYQTIYEFTYHVKRRL